MIGGTVLRGNVVLFTVVNSTLLAERRGATIAQGSVGYVTVRVSVDDSFDFPKIIAYFSVGDALWYDKMEKNGREYTIKVPAEVLTAHEFGMSLVGVSLEEEVLGTTNVVIQPVVPTLATDGGEIPPPPEPNVWAKISAFIDKWELILTDDGDGTRVLTDMGTYELGGGGGTYDHRVLTFRDAVNAHPISAITGLATALGTFLTTAAAETTYALKSREHTHTNKGTLDSITAAFTTALKTAYDQAVLNSHTHNNKNTLDTITGVKTAAWDAANAHVSTTNNPHGVTKSQVGLGNVDNTSDTNKPISTATAAALSGKADLEDGVIPASQLPSYVDDVKEYASLADFPAVGEAGKIYVATGTNLTYRWSGTQYVEISSSLALGETAATAYRGDRGKTAYDHSQVVHDKALVGLGNVDNTSDADKPLSTAAQTALAGKSDTTHNHDGDYAPTLGDDDNYVTDAEKAALHSHANKTALDAVSGTNTGDQTLSGLGGVPTIRTVNGKALSEDITLSASDVGAESDGAVAGHNSSSTAHEDIREAIDAKADLVDGLVPASQLPSYVDDVLEYADFSALPATGTAGKIYVTIDTNLTYRWSGSAYVEISQSLALGETSATAYRGDKGKTAYDHSQTEHAPADAEKNVQSDWDVSDTASDAYIANKPTTMPPTAHASSHNAGGADAMEIDAAAGTGSLRTLGTSPTSAAAGNHNHTSLPTQVSKITYDGTNTGCDSDGTTISLVPVMFGTSATPPAATTVPRGTIYIQYTA